MSRALQKGSYRNPNGLRADSPGSPGRGMGNGLGTFVSKSRTREEIESWISEHTPGESYHAVAAIRHHLKKQGAPITAQSVREGLKQRGWLKEER